MQCPPTPGPGVNFMKPNGFVAAASITSHTLTPSLSHTIAISFTSPMFTLRNVFSRILTSSAASVEDTDRKSTRLNSSHDQISYAVFCLKKKKTHKKSEEHTSELQSRSDIVCSLMFKTKTRIA